MASAAPGPQRQSPSLSADLEAPFPPPARASTLPISIDAPRAADPSHLSPDAAFYPNTSPPRRLAGYDNGEVSGNELRSSRRMHYKAHGDRSRSRRRRRAWKKLLWVKQTYPDNYTDQATFLENLQRNPRLQPYEFWPLVADFTVIVQHVCSVIIFVVCFVGIFQERVSPVAVVGLGSFATFLGWLLWDWWVMQEADDEDVTPGRARSRSLSGKQFRPQRILTGPGGGGGGGGGGSGSGYDTTTRDTNSPLTANSSVSNLPSAMSSASNLHAPLRPSLPKSVSTTSLTAPRYVQSASATSLNSSASRLSGSRFTPGSGPAGSDPTPAQLRQHHHRPSSPLRTERAHLRLGTIKSAVLIYFTLLGLSPILKSLTRSTSSDSIWAMSFWLLAVNIFFFDYSGDWGGVYRFPVASLSTNAALMASTVLASRLPSTGQVFSLTLFSIEVFGLAPVFRRYARHRSWRFHVVLTVLLVLGAGGGVGMILARPSAAAAAAGGGPTTWPWRGGLLGMVVGCAVAALAMGGCSWWLIGLQKYKNEIYGPWDPARPIIISRRHWDE